MCAEIRHKVRQADGEDPDRVLRRAHGQTHHVTAGAPQDDHLQRGTGRKASLVNLAKQKLVRTTVMSTW